MYLSLTLTSLVSLFIAIHAIPIKHDKIHMGEMDMGRVYKTLNKRDDYLERDRDRDSMNYDRYYGDRYGERGYNPSYFRDSYDYRRPVVAANSRMYTPQYYPQANTVGNVYSDADIQNYIAAAAAAAAAATSSNPASAQAVVPAVPVIAAPASGADSLAYQAMLASADPSTLFNSYQAAVVNVQPASTATYPGFTASPETVSNPFTAEIAPPRAQPAALTGPKRW